jgi:transposase
VAELADARLAPKRARLEQALVGQLSPALHFLIRQHLDHWHELAARIAAFDTEIARQLAPMEPIVTRLDAIPGVGRRTAEVVVAEIGPEVTRFPSARHLAAWAGVSPGQRESGGKQRPARTRRGSPWLKAALTEAAWAAARCKSGYLPAQYRRLAARRGSKRAIVAVAHSLVRIIYAMLASEVEYRDLGGDYFDQRDRQGIERRSVQRLRALGYDVTLTRPTPPDASDEVA